MDYRRKHNGPDEIIIPEFVPMCLSMDLLTLMNRGIKIEIGEYNKTLMPFKLPAISKSKEEAKKATGEVD
jgi:hypothetical protein